MNANSTIAALLQGSSNIDRMRREIHDLVALVCGYIRLSYPAPDQSESNQIIFEKQINNPWTIHGRLSGGFSMEPDNQYSFTVYYHIPECTDAAWGFSQAGDFRTQILTELVQQMHESLPAFLELVLTRFPKIEEAWKPLLAASEVKFSI